MTTYKITSETETAKLAEDVAAQLKPNSIICLRGNLGAGKTTFAKYLIKALGVEEDVTSPTFSIIHTYNSKLGEIWHCDLYRIESELDLQELGLDEAIGEKLLIIEWPEIAENILPHGSIKVEFILTKNDEREVTIMHI
jgi:tRNA threonylcarbamoyl adenosine modification protein YjeE